MKTIKLTQGKMAIVDSKLFKSLSRHKWCAVKKTNGFYACRHEELPRREDGKRRRLHIYLHHDVAGHPRSGFEVHHKNSNPLDNRKRNLEFVNFGEHRLKRIGKPCRKIKASRFVGVTKWKNCSSWIAQLHSNGMRRLCEFFKNEEDAAMAYNAAARKWHGVNFDINPV